MYLLNDAKKQEKKAIHVGIHSQPIANIAAQKGK
jgi:hypothetical protein